MSEIFMSLEMLDALQKLSALLETEDALPRTLQTVVDLSATTLPGCDAAGVTVLNGGRERTAAASHDFTLEIDNHQYETGEGPCVSSLHEGEVIAIEAIAVETRWPDFCRKAQASGLRSTLALPIGAEGS